jgi:glycerol-3-phosphate acyltransferase PlsY
MNLYPDLLFVVGAYLVGGIPFGLIYSRIFQREDLRARGSGNIGATNVLRNYGWFPGLTILFLDALKGAGPVIGLYYFAGNEAVLLGVLTGVAAIAGHIFPLYLKFQGGKGVATSAGVFLVLAPIPVAGAFGAFVLVALISRYISVGSITAAIVFPALSFYMFGITSAITVAAALLGLMIIWRHRENIRRLTNGEEEKFY